MATTAESDILPGDISGARMTAYQFGELLGAMLGMVLLGAGLAWVIRRIFSTVDFRISVGLAMLLLALAAGVTNSPGGRPYLVTVLIYGIAGIVAYFIVVMAYTRRPYTPLSPEPLRSDPEFGIGNVGVVPRQPLPQPRNTTGIAWGRGFFRIWLLLAVLYFIAGAAIGWSSLANPYVPGKNVAINLDSETVALLDSYGDIHWAMEDAVRSGTAKKTTVRYGYELYTPVALEPWKFQEYLQKADVEVARYINTEAVARRSQAIPGVIGWLLIPPVIVLLLGWAVGWAISGFRRTA